MPLPQENSNPDSNSTTDNQEFENESNWSESVNDLDTDSGFKDETDSLESKSDTEGDDIDKDALNPNLAGNCEKVCCKISTTKKIMNVSKKLTNFRRVTV